MRNLLANLMLVYLKFFAKLQIKKINPVVIGVGGAAGKSSTCSIIAELLNEKYKVKQGKGKNSETGIPLNILDIEIDDYSFLAWFKVLFKAPLAFLTNNKKYDYFVVEMGIDSPIYPKNMEYLLEIITPNIGILTNINIEHSENFDSLVKSQDAVDRKKEILKLISNQEQLLLKKVDEKGWSIINLDDPQIKKILPVKSRTITISSKDKSADYYISKINVDLDSFEINFKFLKEEYSLKINQPLPKSYAYNFIFAIAVAFITEINKKDSISIIEKTFKLPPGRFSVFDGIKNTTIFDSSYNSSYEAANEVLELAGSVTSRRKIGILGDMRELGSLSETQHKLLAKSILKNLEYAILVGPQMNSYVAPILDEKGFKYLVFDNYSKAKEAILDNIKEKDLIIVKASQNNLFLERAVELLLKNKSDVELLPRRGKYWDIKRKKTS